jgi:hypothetical protein
VYSETHCLPHWSALWQEYTRFNPDGLKVPPEDLMKLYRPELLPYVLHVDNCDDCNEI